MHYQILAMPSLNSRGLPFTAGNGVVGAEAMDSVATNGFESGTSRPPTPHGDGLPDNFGVVVPGVYRSSYPLPVHLNSVAALNLKTIITLVKEPLSVEYVRLMQAQGIAYHVIPIIPNKTPGVCTPQSTINRVLEILINPENHPVLVHCNKGKHRTGCVMACFRRVQGWNLDLAIAEYLRYADPKPRPLDRTYIASYNPATLADPATKVGAVSWKTNMLNIEVLNRVTVDGDGGRVSTSQDVVRHTFNATSNFK